jgi:hypothetical protein
MPQIGCLHVLQRRCTWYPGEEIIGKTYVSPVYHTGFIRETAGGECLEPSQLTWWLRFNRSHAWNQAVRPFHESWIWQDCPDPQHSLPWWSQCSNWQNIDLGFASNFHFFPDIRFSFLPVHVFHIRITVLQILQQFETLWAAIMCIDMHAAPTLINSLN